MKHNRFLCYTHLCYSGVLGTSSGDYRKGHWQDNTFKDQFNAVPCMRLKWRSMATYWSNNMPATWMTCRFVLFLAPYMVRTYGTQFTSSFVKTSIMIFWRSRTYMFSLKVHVSKCPKGIECFPHPYLDNWKLVTLQALVSYKTDT